VEEGHLLHWQSLQLLYAPRYDSDWSSLAAAELVLLYNAFCSFGHALAALHSCSTVVSHAHRREAAEQRWSACLHASLPPGPLEHQSLLSKQYYLAHHSTAWQLDLLRDSALCAWKSHRLAKLLDCSGMHWLQRAWVEADLLLVMLQPLQQTWTGCLFHTPHQEPWHHA
jgi:hypothetical protein